MELALTPTKTSLFAKIERMTGKKMPLVNRELSWLAFNDRVLQEACDPTVPLIDRIRFLAIFSNNLDEFFRVRVATIARLTKIKNAERFNMGFNPRKILIEIQEIGKKQQIRFDNIYNDVIMPELAEQKIFIINDKQLNVSRGQFVRNYFQEKLLSTLVPIMLDGLSEFPQLKDESIYLVVQLSNSKGNAKPKRALIEIPTDVHSRFLILPETNSLKYIILLDDVIRYCLDDLFSIFKYDVFQAYSIKLTRDAEMDLDNDMTLSIVDNISKNLKLRRKGNPVRFVYDSDMPDDLLAYLVRRIGLKPTNLIPGGHYHNFKDFMSFPNVGSKELEYPKTPALPIAGIDIGESMLEIISKKNILVNLPYQSFDYVIHFLREAAIDPKVLSIKITLYRLAQNSRIINALINAARNGKHVLVLLELKARFDEENNIFWTRKLEDEGIKVLYGISQLKVHSKICLVTRKENNKLVHYGNLATGNFNEKTANIYADHSYFTADQAITKDMDNLFYDLEKGILVSTYKSLLVAPLEMRKKIVRLVDKEISNARKGLTSYMILKMNSLNDERMIAKLYEANKAGVKIQLIVRGICCLVPGMKGYSENIEVISIVDKYLEHARVFIFANNGKEQIYLSSADLMNRNLDNRVEVAFPILDRESKHTIREIINIQLADNLKARIVDKQQKNIYKEKQSEDEPNVRSQIATYNFLKSKVINTINK
ncbi:polyphosphate kinase 1 [Solitalea canadensis]|uniref:Polyphosphate kinase n=1 Tax=Solitalea canadensis (strain ATCC 29591 / DSM 3403 / JCM 21819 / LMG 8368 / NBRC 15130 / NCIMB 12057 / USAM 9D) TaxID=929556 RepID=H8KTX3_SOLCM|nr:polyphosphate kinase 1 [Solitalea canadensis]AFD06823.1 polyphosphate kinase 1 [Solitalea canadensis DSM 3403]